MEIGLILVVALIVIGPKKLPELAGQVARTIRELQRTATEFSREITNPVNDIKRDIARPMRTAQREIAKAVDDPYAHLADHTDPDHDTPHHTNGQAAPDDHTADDEDDEDVGAYANIAQEEHAFEIEEANQAPTESHSESANLEADALETAPSEAQLPEVRSPAHSVAFGAAVQGEEHTAPDSTAELTAEPEPSTTDAISES